LQTDVCYLTLMQDVTRRAGEQVKQVKSVASGLRVMDSVGNCEQTRATPRVLLGAWLLTILMMTATTPAQIREADWDVTVPRGHTRVVDFETTDGTWMTVDLSPDGRWIVFDLLAHIYRVPVGGGQAENLTQDSGIALNFQPRYSPDGRTIAFITDRKGQNNLWIMDADGGNPRPVFTDKNVRVWEPAWTPDSQYILVRRQQMDDSNDYAESVWMYHRDGGQGVELLGKEAHAFWPTVSPDGNSVYFHAAVCLGFPIDPLVDMLKGCFQIRQVDLRTGDIFDVTSGRSMQQIRGTSGGAIAPEVSPDGRSLAFARRIADGTISFKGHKFGPRNALWVRDLSTGAERLIMDPIETDIAEQFPTLPRALPGYSWARDGKSIVIAQGGRIRRVWLDTGKVDTIPFTAHVHRVISEMAYAPFRISDGPFQSRFLRWPTASPDGKALVFQAVGKIWLMALPNGVPRRVTPHSFGPSEFSPTWSPDGRWIVFTTWDDERRGHLWKVPGIGGDPDRLTRETGEYINPTWTPDGNSLIVARGAGATGHGRSLAANTWYDLVRVSAAGGSPEFIVRVQSPRQLLAPMPPRVSFGADGRLFYMQGKTEASKGSSDPVNQLVSVRADGSDKRVHANFTNAEEASVSPDGHTLAFEQGSNIYLTPLPSNTGGTVPQIDKKSGQLPVKPLTQEGGLYPHWRDARTLEFGSANHYFTYNVETQRSETTAINLTVPRMLPTGSVALKNARIITLDNRQVIERGTVLVKGSRIACVGSCDTSGVDKVLDLSGKTLIPGWVDAHAHHHRENRGIQPVHDFEQAIYLAYGITTTRDPATSSQDVFPTAEMVEAGITIGPRTYSTGEPFLRSDGPRWNEITSPEVAQHDVNRLASWGATTIKQYLQPRREQRQWLVEAARKSNLMVTAEGEDLFYDLSMIMDGHTGWEHPMLYLPLYSDVAKFFGQAKANYSLTDIVGSTASYNEEYFFQESDVWKDPKQRRWMPWRELIPHARRRMLRPATDYDYPIAAQGLADIIAEGGYGAMGGHGQEHGLGSHWEVWMYASAMGPMEALEIASLGGAHFLGIDKDTGSITVGKLADLMVLNSNPLEDVHNTLNMLYVMKAGRLYDSETLDEIWPERKPFGKYYWVDPDNLRSDDRSVNYWDTPK
jgi:Tol biopolymer transport system component/imidazolonepropionase-like amidohydrolase